MALGPYLAIVNKSRGALMLLGPRATWQWLDSKVVLVCSRSDKAPELAQDYLLGTYGIGAHLTDIQEELIVFRSEHTSNASMLSAVNRFAIFGQSDDSQFSTGTHEEMLRRVE
jgi:hypothetical protein